MTDLKEAKTGKVICKDAIVCSSIWSKARGLILSKRKNLIFFFRKPVKPRLHMVFVFYPIHVIGLDAKKRVNCTAMLRPFQTWKSPSEVQYVIELSKKPYTLPKLGTKLSF